jgi:hypothetical protein
MADAMLYGRAAEFGEPIDDDVPACFVDHRSNKSLPIRALSPSRGRMDEQHLGKAQRG